MLWQSAILIFFWVPNISDHTHKKKKKIFSIRSWENKIKASLVDTGLVIMIHFINNSPGYCKFPISSYPVSFEKLTVSWEQKKTKTSVFILYTWYWVTFFGLLLAEDP